MFKKKNYPSVYAEAADSCPNLSHSQNLHSDSIDFKYTNSSIGFWMM
jgi:hypothetical protein